MIILKHIIFIVCLTDTQWSLSFRHVWEMPLYTTLNIRPSEFLVHSKTVHSMLSFNHLTSKVNQQEQNTSSACMVGSSINFPSESKVWEKKRTEDSF